MNSYQFTRSFAAVLALISFACSEPAAENSTIQLSYEAIPGSGVTLGQGEVDMSAAVYDDKRAFTQQVHDGLVPMVFAELGVDFAELSSEDAPGGYLLETNPSMQSRGDLSPDDATLVSAGLGYVMYQWSVLVTDFSAGEGDTAYGMVRFDDGALDEDLAQLFFEHAASVDTGLEGGYMSFDDEMIFLNLRGSDGQPYSGLDDATFIEQLDAAAASFAGAPVALAESDFADAWLVENDWSTSTTGADYITIITDRGFAMDALDSLQDQYNDQLLQAATTYGWEAQPTVTNTRPPRGYFPWYNRMPDRRH